MSNVAPIKSMRSIPSTKAQRRAEHALRVAEDAKRAERASRKLAADAASRTGSSKTTGKVALVSKKLSTVGMGRTHLSQCVQRYLKVLVDPFDAVAGGACLPLPPCMPSMYFSPWTRGVFETNALGTVPYFGIGFVAVNPYTFLVNNGATESNRSVWYTKSTFEDSGMQSPSSATAVGSVVGIDCVSTPFAFADVAAITGETDNNINYRVLGFGVRVRCITPSMFKGGMVALYAAPMNATLATNIDWAEVFARPTAVVELNGDQWATLCWSPRAPADYDFQSTTGTQTNRKMIAMALNPGGVSTLSYLQFEFEIRGHYELIGAGADFGTVTRMSDPIGGPAAVEYAQGMGEAMAHHGRKIKGREGAYGPLGRAVQAVEAYVASFSGPSGGSPNIGQQIVDNGPSSFAGLG